MNVSTITNSVTRIGGRQLLKVRKHSPEILVVGGVVGVAVAGAMLVRATYKGHREIEKFRMGLHQASVGLEVAKDPNNDYSKSDYTREAAEFAKQTVVDFGRMYGPAVVVGTASVFAILAGHRILQTRHVALAAAYQGLQFTFDEYRKRVLTQMGDDSERALFNGVYKETTLNEETGKKKTETHYSVHGMSQYSRFFDDFNKNYIPGRPDQNFHFLLSQERYLTQKLQANGHLFLNEVYDALGMERSPAGQIVGWVYGSERGDGYVSFGLSDPTNEMVRMFVNGLEDAVKIDFNVDGPIWEML